MRKSATTLVSSFLNGPSSFLQIIVTRTTIKAWMTLNFFQIQQVTPELAALECLKNQCLHFFSIAIGVIFFKLADKEEMHNILDSNFGQIEQQRTELPALDHPKCVIIGKLVSPFLLGCLLTRDLFKIF